MATSPCIIEGRLRRPLAFKAAGKTRLVGTVATLNLMGTEKKTKITLAYVFVGYTNFLVKCQKSKNSYPPPLAPWFIYFCSQFKVSKMVFFTFGTLLNKLIHTKLCLYRVQMAVFSYNSDSMLNILS